MNGTHHIAVPIKPPRKVAITRENHPNAVSPRNRLIVNCPITLHRSYFRRHRFKLNTSPYIAHTERFTRSNIRIGDSKYISKNIPYAKCAELLKKLGRLSTTK